MEVEVEVAFPATTRRRTTRKDNLLPEGVDKYCNRVSDVQNAFHDSVLAVRKRRLPRLQQQMWRAEARRRRMELRRLRRLALQRKGRRAVVAGGGMEFRLAPDDEGTRACGVEFRLAPDDEEACAFCVVFSQRGMASWPHDI